MADNFPMYINQGDLPTKNMSSKGKVLQKSFVTEIYFRNNIARIFLAIFSRCL